MKDVGSVRSSFRAHRCGPGGCTGPAIFGDRAAARKTGNDSQIHWFQPSFLTDFPGGPDAKIAASFATRMDQDRPFWRASRDLAREHDAEMPACTGALWALDGGQRSVD